MVNCSFAMGLQLPGLPIALQGSWAGGGNAWSPGERVKRFLGHHQVVSSLDQR